MIWYLLYPLRGTTEPPQLSQSHPIRRAFQRIGTLVSRHWLLSLALCVAAAVSICYPSIFLYSHPTAGFNRLPQHVWASAKVLHSSTTVRPDIEVRQVWVHGHYMRALEENVLQSGLHIQNELIRGGFQTSTVRGMSFAESNTEEAENIADGLATCGQVVTQPLTWVIHSPLMHWDCSAKAISLDRDLVQTINDQSTRKSYMNLTLRPSSIFAGKAFIKSNVTAADALVITLIALPGSEAGFEWDRRIGYISRGKQVRGRWYMPEATSQLFEFEFKRMSWSYGGLLFVSYLAVAVYVLVSLRKTRAVKSTLGLGLAIIAELTVSIVASFTICGILNIDLTRIPPEVYPFVVLTIGLENMFRLMDAVVTTSATLPTTQRISQALGNVGHLSLAVAAQNLFILRLMYKVVAPNVQSFCDFATIALAFDFLFHLTFFVAVLSADVQRLELQDFLDKINLKRRNSPRRPAARPTWSEALRHGRMPFSTRLAGTAVSLSFVLALNWHYFDNMTLLEMVRSLRFSNAAEQSGHSFSSFTLAQINQRRTPAAWMRMQDHDTVHEVIHFVKPKGSSFVARIHSPVAVVIDGADRSVVPGGSNAAHELIHDIINEHLIPYLLSVVLSVALVNILMNQLFWNELSGEDESNTADYDTNESILNFCRLYRTHEHDIVKMHTSGRNLITVSTDRMIVLQQYDTVKGHFRASVVRTEYLAKPLWPIISITTTESLSWLAFLARDGTVAACKTSNRRLKKVADVRLQEKVPPLFAFVPSRAAETEATRLVVLSSDGHITEVVLIEEVTVTSRQVTDEPITHACLLPENERTLSIVLSLSNGGARLLERDQDGWSVGPLHVDPINSDSPVAVPTVRCITRAPLLGIFIAASLHEVQLFDSATAQLISTLDVGRPIKRNSLRFVHSPRRVCPSCRAVAVHSFTVVFTDADRDECVMCTCRIDGDDSRLICLASTESRQRKGCAGIPEAVVTKQVVARPGSWETTGVQAVIGIRKSAGTSDDSNPILISSNKSSDASKLTVISSNKSTASGSDTPGLAPLRPRMRPPSRSNMRGSPAPRSSWAEAFEEYEAWTLSSFGHFYSQSLPREAIRACSQTQPQPASGGRTSAMAGPHEHPQLYAASTGPVRMLGKRSIAVGVANTVLTITLGGEGRWDDGGGGAEERASWGRGEVGGRRSRERLGPGGAAGKRRRVELIK